METISDVLLQIPIAAIAPRPLRVQNQPLLSQMAVVVRALSRRAVAVPRLASVSAKVAARSSNPRPLMIPSRTFAAAPPKMISRYVLQYKYTPDVLEKRDPHRAGHLELIKEMAAEGHIMSAGAFADPVARLGAEFEASHRWRQRRLNSYPQRRTARCSSSRPARPRSSSRSSTRTGHTSSRGRVDRERVDDGRTRGDPLSSEPTCVT